MSDISYSVIEAHTFETPSPELRFVIRGGEKVLQQKYALTHYGEGDRVKGVDVEWRDVPTIFSDEHGDYRLDGTTKIYEAT